MVGQNILSNKAIIDGDFLEKYSALGKDFPKLVNRAVSRTSQWLRGISMAELGYELKIDGKALRSRFRSYKNGRMSKLWIGVNEIGVHRLGKPIQRKEGVEVGDNFYEGAFISPMESDELLVFRRTGKGRSVELVTENISEDTEAIINNYLPDINRKFEEFFVREFRALYTQP
ncbi:phage tail protein [Vibrio sp. TRT 17S01]|uniref:phage tail protein n=1 Tax=Vibrio sp. TRT 17S01 TaxID=3418505 RepID=UPI003CF1DAF3